LVVIAELSLGNSVSCDVRQKPPIKTRLTRSVGPIPGPRSRRRIVPPPPRPIVSKLVSAGVSDQP
jgi:hypothetical protein